MRAVFGLVLIVGMALAGFAIYMVQGYFEQQNAELAEQRARAAQNVATVDVIAVNRQMTYGEVITTADIQFIKYAEPFLPEGVFMTQEDLFPNGGDELRVVLRQLEENEPIIAIKVTEPGEDAGLTSRLSRGMRAFTIRVDVASGVSGFLNPGDRVDVYWTGRIEGAGRNGGDVTKLIETGVEIIAVDQTADSNRGEASVARTVTVQVTPQEVAALAQAQSSGRLSLSLVGREDDSVVDAIEVDQRSLLGIAEQVVVPEAVEEQGCSIRTRRGAETIDVPIPCTN
ncbi:Flp pilus assembly protein CpaB [Octadecabacter sp. R77987]|uniref:Flp pilus assembly protein CpaB n=1 Tax=Octadecabacter sp. R77987 TaxID=3093874 RepID=UPI0036704D74